MTDKKVRTTFEMDGLFTQEDIDNRHKVMRQCRGCNKWTQQSLLKKKNKPCNNCGINAFDLQSTVSLRTFNPMNKRKVKNPVKKGFKN